MHDSINLSEYLRYLVLRATDSEFKATATLHPVAKAGRRAYGNQAPRFMIATLLQTILTSGSMCELRTIVWSPASPLINSLISTI